LHTSPTMPTSPRSPCGGCTRRVHASRISGSHNVDAITATGPGQLSAFVNTQPSHGIKLLSFDPRTRGQASPESSSLSFSAEPTRPSTHVGSNVTSHQAHVFPPTCPLQRPVTCPLPHKIAAEKPHRSPHGHHQVSRASSSKRIELRAPTPKNGSASAQWITTLGLRLDAPRSGWAGPAGDVSGTLGR
jgi:hypothetical protein